jgi:formylglycine-generating enzyme required for sulfatase activity
MRKHRWCSITAYDKSVHGRLIGAEEGDAMGFDLERWKQQLREPLRRFSADPEAALRRAGATTLFGYLCGMTLFPLVVAAASGELVPVFVALGTVAGNVGGNLIANRVQRWKDEPTAAQELEKELAGSPELRQALDQIITKLQVVEDAQRDMQDSSRRWFASQLARELQSYQADLPRICATLSGVSDSLVVFSQRDTYVNNYITLIVNQLGSPQLPEAELRQDTERYLQYLVDRYQYLDLKGMGISERVALRLSLLDMYVPLHARLEVPKGETWARELRLAGRNLQSEDGEETALRLSEPWPVLHLLRQNDGLIILGDPGAGKTTLLKYLALRLARGEQEELGLGPMLPVLVPLSAYATALVEDDVRLDEFIADYFCERVADVPLDQMLAAALEQGTALILLDGLDEVRERALRNTVAERVADFYSYHRRAGNKFALTSRIVGYREVRPTAEGLVECTLVDFGEQEIKDFVARWTRAIERAARGETDFAEEEAQRERDELIDAVRRNPGVRALAANPLLLTILALMKRQGVKLPERRVQLYEKYVETLLSSWNLARGLGRPTSRDLDVVQTVRILAPLALWMHERSPGVGLVKREDATRKLTEVYAQQGDENPEQSAKQFLEDVRDYAGMLVESGAGQYGFIHLTFEEYLAAVGLARLGQGRIEPVLQVLSERVGDGAWREVALLTIGYLGIVQQWEEVASGLVDELLDRQPGEPGEAAVLVGDAVADASPGGVTVPCKERVVEVLLGTMGDSAVRAPLRACAGRALARLGDPRPEVMTLEGMQFCYVPPGPFWMGSGDEDKVAIDAEKPLHEVDIPYGYWVARYPVTSAQFHGFVDDPHGYRASTWWTKAGLEWLRRRSRSPIFGEPWTLPNHPIVEIAWYEAVAFSNWLALAFRTSHLLPEGCTVRLPSEAEWEKAARGGEQVPERPLIAALTDRLDLSMGTTMRANLATKRRYPWGNEPDPERANCGGTDVRACSALGCFTGGVSPYGVEELGGNTYEWCRTKWTPSYSGYEPDEDLGGDAQRVLRGGAFWDMDRYLRCSYRMAHPPGTQAPYFGIRIVVAPSVP